MRKILASASRCWAEVVAGRHRPVSVSRPDPGAGKSTRCFSLPANFLSSSPGSVKIVSTVSRRQFPYHAAPMPLVFVVAAGARQVEEDPAEAMLCQSSLHIRVTKSVVASSSSSSKGDTRRPGKLAKESRPRARHPPFIVSPSSLPLCRSGISAFFRPSVFGLRSFRGLLVDFRLHSCQKWPVDCIFRYARKTASGVIN